MKKKCFTLLHLTFILFLVILVLSKGIVHQKNLLFLLLSAIWRVQRAPWWVPAERSHSPSDGETAKKAWISPPWTSLPWTSPPWAPPSQSPWAESQPKSPSQPPSPGDREHS